MVNAKTAIACQFWKIARPVELCFKDPQPVSCHTKGCSLALCFPYAGVRTARKCSASSVAGRVADRSEEYQSLRLHNFHHFLFSIQSSVERVL